MVHSLPPGVFCFSACQRPEVKPDNGTIRGLAGNLNRQWLWHKKCIQQARREFSTTHPATGDFDGKDRRRRHENGQGKRSQVR
jgi:hypothetical protein